jgi:hypothetical protein
MGRAGLFLATIAIIGVLGKEGLQKLKKWKKNKSASPGFDLEEEMKSLTKEVKHKPEELKNPNPDLENWLKTGKHKHKPHNDIAKVNIPTK